MNGSGGQDSALTSFKEDDDEESENLTSVIEQAVDAIDDEQVSIGDLVETVGQVSLLPLILLPAIALATPLSGIPAFSTVMGIIIFSVSAQMLMQRSDVWLPLRLLRLEAKSTRVQQAFKWTVPVTTLLDEHAHQRLTFLTRRPFVLVPQILCLFSGMMLPLLEFVPFSSSLVGIAVGLLAFGMLRRDGVILVIAVLPYFGVIWLISRVI